MKFITKLALIVMISLLSVQLIAQDDQTPWDNEGWHTVKKVKIQKNTTTGLKRGLNVWYPENVQDAPVMVFISGLNGFAPGFMYTDLMKKIASRGIIAVIPSGKILLPNMYKKRGQEMIDVVRWMKENFTDTLDFAVDNAPVANTDKILLSGHSSGAQAVLVAYRALKKDIAGIFLMDPVDGDPFKMLEPSITDGEQFDLQTPVLILASGLGPQPGFNFKWWPSCAPVGVSSHHFYDAFTSNKWYVNFVDYGHIDMLDNFAKNFVTFTRFCSGAEWSLDFTMLRNFIAGSLHSFIEGAVNGKCEMLDYIENPESMPITADVKNNGHCAEGKYLPVKINHIFKPKRIDFLKLF